MADKVMFKRVPTAHRSGMQDLPQKLGTVPGVPLTGMQGQRKEEGEFLGPAEAVVRRIGFLPIPALLAIRGSSEVLSRAGHQGENGRGEIL